MDETLDIDAAFAALRETYAKTIPGEVAELVGVVEKALAALNDPTAVGEARHLTHRLAGTSASYEFEEISRAARALETFFIQVAKGLPVPADAIARQRENLQELQALAARL
jgi:HPt (histidine-containing phosphotransfer) domain-containing protein